MKLPKLNQKGFGHIEIILVAFVIFAIIGVGYYTLKVRSGGIFNSKAEVSTAGSAGSLSNTNAEKAAAERDYTFELKKDDRAVANGATVSGPVSVGVNMNVDRNLTNVKFFVDGEEKGSKQGIGLTGFREFATWNTKFSTNGTHTITVKATGSSGREFELFSSATNTKSLSVTVDNGTATRAPAAGNTTGGTNGGGSSTTQPSGSSTTAPAVTLKPQLSISPGPLTGVAGSKSGTVEGDKVTGGVVFTVSFKRPKTENYDLKTMQVVLFKDGQPRIVMANNNNSLEVKEEGDFKIYTFKRYYGTANKPNGTSQWSAFFNPNVSSPDADKTSNTLTVNVDNPVSTAEETCQDLEGQVNSLFTSMRDKINARQVEIREVNSNIDRRYQALGLATSNPIPGYDDKRARITSLDDAINARQAELKALKLDCASDPDQDAGAKVVAFKTKLEEARGAVAAMNSATIDLLGELRSRVPQNDDGDTPTPGGFTKHETPCYSFAARRDFITSNPSYVASGPCNKIVSYNLSASGAESTFTITPDDWLRPNGTLAENVAAAKAGDLADGPAEITDEVSFKLDGYDAVKYIVSRPTPIKTLRVIVSFPHVTNGQNVGGFDITTQTGGISTTSDSALNPVTRSANTMLSTWRWADTPPDDDNAAVPDGFKKMGTMCYSAAFPEDTTAAKIFSGSPNNACSARYQYNSASDGVFVRGISGVTGLDALVEKAKELTLRDSPAAQFSPAVEAVIGGQPARKIEYTVNGRPALLYVSTLPFDYQYTDARGFPGADFAEGSFIRFVQTGDSLGNPELEVINKILASWQWKSAPPAPDEKFSAIETDCFSVELPRKNRQQFITNPPIPEGSCETAYAYTSKAPFTFGKFYSMAGRDQRTGATLRSNIDLRRSQLAQRNVTLGPEEPITLDGQPGVKYTASYPTTSGQPDTDYEYIVSTPRTYTYPKSGGGDAQLNTLMFVLNTNDGDVPGGFTKVVNDKVIETWRWK